MEAAIGLSVEDKVVGGDAGCGWGDLEAGQPAPGDKLKPDQGNQDSGICRRGIDSADDNHCVTYVFCPSWTGRV